jgi:hypothetical protein
MGLKKNAIGITGGYFFDVKGGYAMDVEIKIGKGSL